VFLLPTFPDDAICFVAGLSEIRTRRFLVLLVVGRLPSFAAVALAGDQLATDDLLALGAVGALVVGATALGYLRRDAFERVVERASKRFDAE
jgi:uncharacterized membrane protein YdjX (TVP38/TMEM64 family)